MTPTPPGSDGRSCNYAVLDAGGADEAHPLASLAALLGDRIEAYENAYPEGGAGRLTV